MSVGWIRYCAKSLAPRQFLRLGVDKYWPTYVIDMVSTGARVARRIAQTTQTQRRARIPVWTESPNPLNYNGPAIGADVQNDPAF